MVMVIVARRKIIIIICGAPENYNYNFVARRKIIILWRGGNLKRKSEGKEKWENLKRKSEEKI